jgi:hypothetical protein
MVLRLCVPIFYLSNGRCYAVCRLVLPVGSFFEDKLVKILLTFSVVMCRVYLTKFVDFLMLSLIVTFHLYSTKVYSTK